MLCMKKAFVLFTRFAIIKEKKKFTKIIDFYNLTACMVYPMSISRERPIGQIVDDIDGLGPQFKLTIRR
jgi:hypothetical protein